MGSPLGAIYSTNITPDPETGIGGYSLEDFDRAVRQGVAKDGHRLYPAMPYPSYAKLTDADVAALYDFFMKQVPAVHQANLPNEIPVDAEFSLAACDLESGLSPKAAAMPPRAAMMPTGIAAPIWCRGSAIAAPATRRAASPGRKRRLTTAARVISPERCWMPGTRPTCAAIIRTGLGGWSKDDVIDFLKTGHNRAEAVFGSMIDVVNNSTPYMSDGDLNAIAVYLKSLPATSEQQPVAYDDATTAALRSGTRAATGRHRLCRLLRELPWLRWQGLRPIYAGARRQSCRARQRSVVAHQSGAERFKSARRQRHAGFLSHAAIPAAVLRSGDRRRRHLHSQRLGQQAPAVTAAEVAKLRKTTDPTSDQVIILKMR